MLYRMETLKSTAVTPSVVDAHSLLHRKTSKAVRACAAADVLDGVSVLQNLTLRLAAAAYDVSIGSVARARRLTPEQREAVRRGQRPLVMPSTVPVLPAVSPQQRLVEIVDEIGLDRTLNLLNCIESVPAAA